MQLLFFKHGLIALEKVIIMTSDWVNNLLKKNPDLTLPIIVNSCKEASVYKGYKRDTIEMRGDRAEMSDFPLYLNTVAGGLDCRNQVFSFSCGCFRKL